MKDRKGNILRVGDAVFFMFRGEIIERTIASVETSNDIDKIWFCNCNRYGLYGYSSEIELIPNDKNEARKKLFLLRLEI